MPERYITELEKSNIRGQAITYFGLALLLMTSIASDLKFIKPTFGLNLHIYPLPFPLPGLDLGSWPVLIIDLIILGLSLFFMSAIFVRGLLRPAMKVTRFLKFPTLALIPMSFFIASGKGLAVLGNAPFPWFVIFAWCAIILIFALEVHLIIEAVRGLKLKNHFKSRQSPKHTQTQLSKDR